MSLELNFELKVGNVEIRFGGSEKMFDSKIEPIVKDLIQFGKTSTAEIRVNEVERSVASAGGKSSLPTMTVKSVAAKFGAASGSELLYAAVASLATLKKKETFTRQELNDEMKQATGFYKTSYSSNLSNYIDTLCKEGTIIETSKDTYAAQAAALANMEQRLA